MKARNPRFEEEQVEGSTYIFKNKFNDAMFQSFDNVMEEESNSQYSSFFNGPFLL